MAITYKSSGTVKPYNNTTSVPAPAPDAGAPPNFAEGDIIVMGVFSASSTSSPFTYPSGFTEVALLSNGTARASMAWKRIDSGSVNDSTYTVTTNSPGQNFIAQTHRYRGVVASGSPIRSFDTDLSSNIVLSLGSTPADDMLVCVATCSSTNDQTNTVGWNLRGGNLARLMVQDKVNPSTGTVSLTVVSTGIGRNSQGFLISLIPDAAAGGELGNVIIGGLKTPIVNASVIVGGVKQPATPSVIIGGIKQPLI